jgi:hypothetical protein
MVEGSQFFFFCSNSWFGFQASLFKLLSDIHIDPDLVVQIYQVPACRFKMSHSAIFRMIRNPPWDKHGANACSIPSATIS